MEFSSVEAKFERLKAQFEAGDLTEGDFKAQLQDLMIEDEQGRWWAIGPETGQWYVHEGEEWVVGEPQPTVERGPGQVEAPTRDRLAGSAVKRQHPDHGRRFDRVLKALSNKWLNMVIGAVIFLVPGSVMVALDPGADWFGAYVIVASIVGAIVFELFRRRRQSSR